MGEAQDGTEHVGHEQMLLRSVLFVSKAVEFAVQDLKFEKSQKLGEIENDQNWLRLANHLLAIE